MPSKWLQERADGSKNGHGIGFEGPGVVSKRHGGVPANMIKRLGAILTESLEPFLRDLPHLQNYHRALGIALL